MIKNVYRWWSKAIGRAARIAAPAALLVLLGSGAARAVTITVDSLADDTAAGHCDLREAINSSNMLGNPTGTCAAGSGTDTVQFSVTGTITLTSSRPIIISKLTINGPVAATPQITIDGANSFMVMLSAPNESLNMSHVEVANGKGNNANAGGITAEGSLTLSNCVFSGN